MTNQFKKYAAATAFAVTAALFSMEASAQSRPNPGCDAGGCETPTTPGDTNIDIDNNIDNDVNVDVDTNINNDVTVDTNIDNNNTNTNTNTNVANGGNANNSIRIEGDVTANAPAAVATSNGWTCERRIGVSVGVGVPGSVGLSGGLNIPMGNNQTCIDTNYANTMIGAGVQLIINGRTSDVVVSGADAMAVGVGTMMQNSENFNNAARHVADMNCQTVNFADRFRANCGNNRTATVPVVSAPAYTK